MSQTPEHTGADARAAVAGTRTPAYVGALRQPSGQSLADVLERVLDKGIVVVGDIQVRLLDIELLTIKVRLMIASVERAREMGINWWEGDPFVTLEDRGEAADGDGDRHGHADRSRRELELERRVEALEQRVARPAAETVRRAQAEGGSAS